MTAADEYGWSKETDQTDRAVEAFTRDKMTSGADYTFSLRASTGETFTVLHFPDRGEFRRFETTDGERVEGELVPEDGGHTSMRFWVHRGRLLGIDDDGVLVVDFKTDRIAAVMVEGSERRL